MSIAMLVLVGLVYAAPGCAADTTLAAPDLGAPGPDLAVEPPTDLAVMPSIDMGAAPPDLVVGPDLDVRNVLISTIAVGKGVDGIAANPVTNKVYAANEGAGTVSVIDAARNVVAATVTTGHEPSQIAIDTQRNRVYITDEIDDTVVELDGAKDTVTGASQLPARSAPDDLALNSASGRLYTVNEDGNTLSILDITQSPPVVLNTIATDMVPDGVAILYGNTPGADRVYFAAQKSINVTVIDGLGMPVGSPMSLASGLLDTVAINQSTKRAYVAVQTDDVLAVIDIANNNAVTARIPVGKRPEGIAIDEKSNVIYVVNSGGASYQVIDGAAGKVMATVATGPGPLGIAFNSTTRCVYVTDEVEGSVRVYGGY